MKANPIAVTALALLLAACSASAPAEETESTASADMSCGQVGQACCVEHIPRFGTYTYCTDVGATCQAGTCNRPPSCGYAGEACCIDHIPRVGNFPYCSEGAATCQSGKCALQQGAPTFDAPVMANPTVVLVLWGRDYQATRPDRPNPRAEIAIKILTDLVTGPFINGLAQYGISKGNVLPVYIDEPTPPVGTVRTYVDIQNKLTYWLDKGIIPRKPAVNDIDTLYFILPPTEDTLWLDDVTKPTDGTQGKHFHLKYNAASTRDDLIWTTVKTYNPQDPTRFIDESNIISHELVEALNDPIGGRIELGDECDGQDGGNWGKGVPPFLYRGEWVQQYWSVVDDACIHGDAYAGPHIGHL
jgi:hypothetical protein